MEDARKKYSDIIDLPHHVSTKHPQMSMIARAAQFSPFAAIDGHHEGVDEVARETEEFLELDESVKSVLNDKLNFLAQSLDLRPEISITYFKPDEKKSGGAYCVVKGVIRKIKEYERLILLDDNTAVPIDMVFGLEGEIFNTMD